MSTLQWGLSDNQLKQKFPQLEFLPKVHKLLCGRVVLHNFPSDCGALVLTNANNADFDSLKLAAQVASECGFSKIFATVVTSPPHAEKIAKEFRRAQWRCISKSVSNRNEYKNSYVFVKIIKDCKYKGY